MPIHDAAKIKRSLDELGKACVIAGNMSTKLVQQVPELANEMNDAMKAFGSAFNSLKKAHIKVLVLEKVTETEGVDGL